MVILNFYFDLKPKFIITTLFYNFFHLLSLFVLIFLFELFGYLSN